MTKHVAGFHKGKPEKEDRLSALREVSRLPGKSGVAIISYLNAWGTLRYGVARFSNLYEDFSFLSGMTEGGGHNEIL